ncbi:ATP-grasp domain-containing protein [Streptomyces sp. CA-251387]|uniref:ATP-grasp domain-containing protein n=1 Tax=Streptomyces sp. CA-251387 TaxID=3240064 RepID=UPI003D8DA64F
MNSSHVLLLNRNEGGVLGALRDVDSSLDVSIITEPQFLDEYPSALPVQVVQSVRDLTAVREAALELGRRQPIDRVVCGHERCQQAGGYLRSLFALPGMGYEQLNLFSNKAAMKSALSRAGLPLAEFRVVPSVEHVSSAAAELTWPIVVKPAVGQGSRDTFFLGSNAELNDLLDSSKSQGLRSACGPLLVERFIPMEAELHCDAVVWSGNVDFVTVSRYFEPLLGRRGDNSGTYLLREDDPYNEPARRMNTAVVRALGLREGVTHLELFVTPSGLVIGEIACRPAGAGVPEAIRMRHGVDLWRSHIDIALGTRPALPLPEQRPGKGILANVWLPVRPGRITRLSRAGALAELPDVVHVDVTAKVGDIVRSPLGAGARTGNLYLEIPHEDQLPDRLRALSDQFTLEVEHA